MALQLRYVGAKGTKLFQFLDIKQPRQAQITAADLACVPDPAQGNYCPVGFGVPRAYLPNFFYLNQERSAANSIYNALRTSLHVSEWHGLSSQANLVWSHSIDTARRSRGLRTERGAAPEQHKSSWRPGQLELRHSTPLYLEFRLRISEIERRYADTGQRLGLGRNPQPSGWPAVAPELRVSGGLFGSRGRIRPVPM